MFNLVLHLERELKVSNPKLKSQTRTTLKSTSISAGHR